MRTSEVLDGMTQFIASSATRQTSAALDICSEELAHAEDEKKLLETVRSVQGVKSWNWYNLIAAKSTLPLSDLHAAHSRSASFTMCRSIALVCLNSETVWLQVCPVRLQEATYLPIWSQQPATNDAARLSSFEKHSKSILRNDIDMVTYLRLHAILVAHLRCVKADL